MPTRVLDDPKNEHGHRLDVRADPLDIRDRVYQPQLVQLPCQFPSNRWLEVMLPVYAERHVRDQGEDGACTGFGLAATIGYLLFAERYRDLNSPDPLEDEGPEAEQISPWMLYRLARLYDEWEGEEYSGSSCRGAMKGWHKHGACLWNLWPRKGEAKNAAIDADPDWALPAPVPRWQVDAARRPLGAYYRVEKSSVRDIQSAIHQVGVVYASARVHGGWVDLDEQNEISGFPLVRRGRPDGGHAFAMIGYNEVGFLIQNSWGQKWGNRGFAVLPYEDWSPNAMDAWVAVLGAPVTTGGKKSRRDPSAREDTTGGNGDDSTHDGGRGPVLPSVFARGGYRLGAGESLITINTRPLDSPVLSPKPVGDDEDGATEPDGPVLRAADESWVNVVTLAAGNEGRALRQDVNDLRVEDQYEHRVVTRPSAAFDAGFPERIVLYFHGGLNEEDVADRRTRAMAPAFHANDVYPLFYRWKTGLRDTFRHIAEDLYREMLGERAEGIGDFFRRVREEANERVDRYVETFCRTGPPKSLWAEMKENAEKAAGDGYASALVLVAAGLSRLQAMRPGLEIHLVGHSAGSFAAGHLLRLFGESSTPAKVKTVTLWAPACPLKFACSHLLPALEGGVLQTLHVDVLTEKLEQDDVVAKLYHKSLLYLISRSLEERHKEPLFGMETLWEDLQRACDGDLSDRLDRWAADPRDRGGSWNQDSEFWLPSEFKTFADAWDELGDRVRWQSHVGSAVLSEDGAGNAVDTAPRSHGSFDNDVRIFNALLARLRGDTPPDVPVGRLTF